MNFEDYRPIMALKNYHPLKVPCMNTLKEHTYNAMYGYKLWLKCLHNLTLKNLAGFMGPQENGYHDYLNFLQPQKPSYSWLNVVALKAFATGDAHVRRTVWNVQNYVRVKPGLKNVKILGIAIIIFWIQMMKCV